MRTLNIPFNDKEYAKIIKVKQAFGMSWREWILWLVERSELENNNNVRK